MILTTNIGIERTGYGWYRLVNLDNPRFVIGLAFRLRKDAEAERIAYREMARKAITELAAAETVSS